MTHLDGLNPKVKRDALRELQADLNRKKSKAVDLLSKLRIQKLHLAKMKREADDAIVDYDNAKRRHDRLINGMTESDG